MQDADKCDEWIWQPLWQPVMRASICRMQHHGDARSAHKFTSNWTNLGLFKIMSLLFNLARFSLVEFNGEPKLTKTWSLKGLDWNLSHSVPISPNCRPNITSLFGASARDCGKIGHKSVTKWIKCSPIETESNAFYTSVISLGEYNVVSLRLNSRTIISNPAQSDTPHRPFLERDLQARFWWDQLD